MRMHGRTTFKVTLKTVVYVGADRNTDSSEIGEMAREMAEPSDWDIEEIEEVCQDFED